MKPDQLYDDWRKELQIWEAINTALGVKSKVQAGYLFQALEGTLRQAVLSELSTNQICSDNGVENIVMTLNHFYSGNDVQKAFNAFDDLIQFKCAQDVSLEKFLAMFQSKVNRVKSTGTMLSDGLLGYMLLKAANLPHYKQELVKATCDTLTFNNVKTQLKKIGLPNRLAEVSNEQNIHYDHLPSPTPLKCYPKSRRHERFSNCLYAPLLKRKVVHHTDSLFTTTVAENFDGMTLDKAVIDTCCSHTVVGDIWFQSYVDSLSRNDRSSVYIQKCRKKYRLGDGSVHLSKSCAVFPVYIGNSKFKLNVSIIKCNIPLILGSDALQRTNAKIHRASATIRFLGFNVPSTFSSSGHMFLQIGRSLDVENQEAKKVLSRVLSSRSAVGMANYSKVIARKLHLQFCHPPANRLIEFLQRAGVFDRAIFNSIEEIAVECELCSKSEPSLERACSKINFDLTNRDISQHSSSESESDSEDDNDEPDENNQVWLSEEWICVKNNKDLPKVNSFIYCKFPNFAPIVQCQILSRAGKLSAANWHFLNIQEQGEEYGKCCSFKDAFWCPDELGD